jgi:hypothetical protein
MAVYTAVNDGSVHFQAQLYTGNASTLNVVNGGNSNLQPDWVWVKNYGTAGKDHGLFDSSRGTTKMLISNTNGSQSTIATSLTSFNSDGFTLGSDGGPNANSSSNVAWQWKATGGTQSTNNDGSVTTNVQLNSTAGFSIVKWTGNGTTTGTIGHGLGATPDFIIRKNYETSSSWACAFPKQATNQLMQLNSTNGFGLASGMSGYNANTFTDGSGSASDVAIAYCFKNIQGYSNFGTYEGNGAEPAGPFIYTGFSPSYIMVKASSEAGQGWIIGDNSRDPTNVAVNKLFANTNGAASAAVGDNNWDFLSNGFKIVTQDDGMNKDGVTYSYAAFAKNPFVTSDSIPTTAR